LSSQPEAPKGFEVRMQPAASYAATSDKVNRVLVTIHLPIDLGVSGQVMKAVSRIYKQATVRYSADGQRLEIVGLEVES
jgi:hypothetical protein